MTPTNRVAVALAQPDTTATLETLHRINPTIGLAEIRLDRMHSFDLERLIGDAPCPLIITCRASREGGSFKGGEAERLEILSQASALNCAYVDVEWDCVHEFENRGESTQIIVSRHYYDEVPRDLYEQYRTLRPLADVVKLVGFADKALEAIRALEVAAQAETPIISLAMGQDGVLTRLLAPCFDHCLLTYGALEAHLGTAPGQLSVTEMVERYALDRVTSATSIEVVLYTDPADEQRASADCGGNGDWLRVAVLVEPGSADSVSASLTQLSPRIAVSVLPPTVA